MNWRSKGIGRVVSLACLAIGLLVGQLEAAAPAPLLGVSYRLDVLLPNARYQPYEPAIVKAGTKLQLVAGDGLTQVVWRKDNVEIVMNQRIHSINGSLFIENFLPQDAGTYSADGFLPLEVRGGVSDRMANVSVRGDVVGGKSVLIAGFYVSGSLPRTFLVRGIGPSLGKFGISNYLSRPKITIYDKDGKVYENSFVYTAVVGGLTPESHIAQVSEKVGAFALGTAPGDVVELRPMNPGVYTVVLTGENEDSGEALIEVYDGGPM